MNDLNSIIAEGTCHNLFFRETNDYNFLFSLHIKRIGKGADGVRIELFTTIWIQCAGALGLLCKDRLKEGRGVRVVGNIQNDKNGEVVIVAGHIVFKPVRG